MKVRNIHLYIVSYHSEIKSFGLSFQLLYICSQQERTFYLIVRFIPSRWFIRSCIIFLSFLIYKFVFNISWFRILTLSYFPRANAQQPKLFVGMILILIFAEALALYGLIVGIILSSRAGQSRAEQKIVISRFMTESFCIIVLAVW